MDIEHNSTAKSLFPDKDGDIPEHKPTKNLMAWLPLGGDSNAEKILHLKPLGEHYYKPYTAFPHLKRPDYPEKNGSKGYATMQYLFKLKWEFEDSSTAAKAKFLDFPVPQQHTTEVTPCSG